MTRSKTLLLLAAVFLAASCATAPPAEVTPAGDDRFLIDPRTGFTTTVPLLAAAVKQFDGAWRFALQGNDAEAQRRLTGIRRTRPDYVPVSMLDAALDIRAGRYAEATKKVDAALVKNPDYTAALVYQAEIAVREKRTRTAWTLYKALEARKDAPPAAAERVGQMQRALFAETLAAARSASGDTAIKLLREALALDPAAFEPRIALAQNLVAQRQFEEARKELDPLLDASADRTEVQEMLAEIDAGRGRYEEAILRFDRLAKSTKDARYTRRLEEIKQEWSAANMPAYYRTALESSAITREHFSVLLYWTIPSIRFARNLGTPPIAIDVAEAAGRDEIIRAIAIGLFEVDPITRAVNPDRLVTADRLARHLSRILLVRGAACAKGLPSDRVLAACSVTSPLATHPPDDPITGREALAMLQDLAGHL